ncbi:hypothetical protein GTR00_03590 [Kineococcus sp. T90]|nr:hypothetical protein [Kineococcus indalonis]
MTPIGRLKLARLIVDDRWPIRRAAERFQVSWPTAARWADRLLELRAGGGQEEGGLVDRSSRPHRSPTRTRRAVVKKVVHLRTTRGWGPARIGPRLGLAVSTVAAVIVREGLPRLCDVDLADRQRIRREVRRYEHAAAGDLVHIDVKKLGVIPTAAAGASSAAAVMQPRQHGLAPSATPTCTPSSMTTPAWPSPRSSATRRAPPRPRSGRGPTPGSPTAASPSRAA